MLSIRLANRVGIMGNGQAVTGSSPTNRRSHSLVHGRRRRDFPILPPDRGRQNRNITPCCHNRCGQTTSADGLSQV